MAKRRRRRKKRKPVRIGEKLKSLLKLTRKRKKLLAKIGFAAAVIGVSFLFYTIPSMGREGLIQGMKAFMADPEGFIGGGVSLPLTSATGVKKENLAGILKRIFPEKPKLSFVIDDIGYTLENRQLLEKLGRRVTYSIMPLLRYSKTFDEMARRKGAEILLHLPMESVSERFPGPGLITNRMTPEQLSFLLDRDLRSVPHRTGVNNHMGSLATENPRLMGAVFDRLKKENLFFLDSFTNQNSVAFEVGEQVGIPVLRRDVFLDNVDTLSAIREKIRELARIGREKGYAIGIGHYHPNTLAVLAEEIPRLEREGFEMVPLARLVKEGKQAHYRF